MAEIDTIYIILGAQAVAMLITTAAYSILRLRKEERKVVAAEASAAASKAAAEANKAAFDSMTVYHAKRLEIEEAKLELAKKNGGQK